MITKITTLEDVRIFARQLISEGLSFHPDDDFNDYININSKLPSYSKEDAELRNHRMNECFEVCEVEGVDIYEIMMSEITS